ncbi:MAG: hypothetical protein N2555_01360, partial [Endomicrobia bacterium]|nr:hypothetical protein [Endomicrobiia bacterium]
VVLSTYRTASNTIYSVDGSQVGFNVEVNGVRTIWYFLQMPTDTSCAGEQKIRIYIIAEEQ